MSCLKQKLIVFSGKPGVGKSTLINYLFKNDQIIDVLPFVKRYEKDGKILESDTIHAYEDMYKYINNFNFEGNVILELGTNHPQLNIEELFNLDKKFILKIFLCIAPKDICLERALKRGRKFDKKALIRRLNKNFPDSHLPLFENYNINYCILDMEKSLDKIKSEVEKY